MWKAMFNISWVVHLSFGIYCLNTCKNKSETRKNESKTDENNFLEV